MPAPAEHGRDGRGVDPRRPAARHGEDALVHLHEQHQRPRVGEVDDLVREVRDALDVVEPVHGGDQHLLPCRIHGLERVQELVQEIALGGAERRVQVLGDEILARAVAQAPRERVRVPLRRRRVRQRARVLVDAERERGRLERCRRELSLGEDPDEGRRQRAVGRDDRRVLVHPVGKLRVLVVVEEDLLHAGVERHGLELAEARRGRGLDHDQAADRVELEAARLDDVLELVRVQAIEVANVAVQRADRHDRARIEMPRGEHRRERVEVGVPVGGDDLLGPHEPHSAPRACPILTTPTDSVSDTVFRHRIFRPRSRRTCRSRSRVRAASPCGLWNDRRTFGMNPP